ncbi:hypothetical protein [Paenibacillus aceti]|uniref:XRE family transcriptional regulator n=1 Tax=Paenibacillus aceti TaxID=1820010 RepID=A0ABQ1W6W6_9BACL|nr:hypothetical protein [Paenibacillus aceti]GGG15779.1 hypothetical protein GCM10010913_42210 [Paenibacillus aceti]
MRFIKPKTKKLTIAGKQVTASKIKLMQWSELSRELHVIPRALLSALTAEKEDIPAFILVALDQSLSEIARIVSILTGIEPEDIEKNATASELIEYLSELIEINEIRSLAKKVRALFEGSIS